MEKSCFFIGHRDVNLEKTTLLVHKVVEKLIHDRVTAFFVGNHGNFDAAVTAVLQQAKQDYPQILCYLALAFPPARRKVTVPAFFDGLYCLDGQERTPPRAAIPKLNESMLKQVDILVANVSHPSSGSYKLLQQALTLEQKGKLRVINLADDTV